MGGWNVPDDWGCYYNKCLRCGSRYHASEGGCGCLDDHVECAGSPRMGDTCYVHVDEVIEWNGQDWCVDHLVCDGCGEPDGDKGEHLTALEGDLYCRTCIAEE